MNDFNNLMENYLKEQKFYLIEDKIKSLFSEISNANELRDTEFLFKELENIQFELAKLAFKDKVVLSPFLRQFVYDFDRIDDDEIKIFLYERIKVVYQNE
ncbi:hypothetical protein PG630_01200 [Riemerella anatipestifer]|nr:hypothetical protein [Riemerella anatipestifer]